MATPLHGKDGSVKVSGSAVALVDAWSADVDNSLADVTSMDSAGWVRQISGIKSVKGSIKVRYAEDDAGGQSVLVSNVFGGSAVGLTLYGSGTAKSLAGTAFLKWSVESPHDDAVNSSFDFESTGAWAYA